MSTAVYELPGEALVVKRYTGESRWKQAKEVHVYSLLAGVAGAPSVVHIDTARGVTVLTRVPGEPLSSVRVDTIEDVYRQIGELQAAVHTITQPAFGYLTTSLLDPAPDNTAYMSERFATKLAEFADRDGDPAIHRLASEYVAERSDLLGNCAGAVLCHNDLHEGNVLVEQGTDGWRVTGLVDVENAIAADPLMDLAKTVQYDLTRSPGKVAGLLAGYGPLPPDGPARLTLYRLFHALELWDWFAEIVNTEPLAAIAADIRELASP
ncbi:aminoglycoside phosphotransferase family protein [Actinophytocola sp.]|uniref:phosphotransferase family protein n=1 Tax=Actinophytocola sp. TaxID=1872138 RepID=UPI002ED149ED